MELFGGYIRTVWVFFVFGGLFFTYLLFDDAKQFYVINCQFCEFFLLNKRRESSGGTNQLYEQQPPPVLIKPIGIIEQEGEKNEQSKEEAVDEKAPLAEPTCSLPDLDPWDPDLVPFLRPNSKKNRRCSRALEVRSRVNDDGRLVIKRRPNTTEICSFRFAFKHFNQREAAV